MVTPDDESVMVDWISEDFADEPPSPSIEEDLSSAEFLPRAVESPEAHQLAAEFRAALGEDSKAEISEVLCRTEAESIAWFARRNRLDSTSFYRRAIRSIGTNEAFRDFEVQPTRGGIFGIRAEIAYALLSERRFLEGVSAVKGYGTRADDVASNWWRSIVQDRPEDFQARWVGTDWSDWFDEDGRCLETWMALDVRKQILHVVRVSAPWDE